MTSTVFHFYNGLLHTHKHKQGIELFNMWATVSYTHLTLPTILLV